MYKEKVVKANLKWPQETKNESFVMELWRARGSFTISQLNESIRLYFPGIIFVCETKRKRLFVSTVCKKFKFKNRWNMVDPAGKKEGY